MPIWSKVGSALTKAAKFTSTRRYKVTAKDGDHCKQVTLTVRAASEGEAIDEAKRQYDTKRFSDFKVKNPMAKKTTKKKNCSTKARNGKKTAKKSKKNPAKVTIRRDGVTKTLYGAAAAKVLGARKTKAKNAAKRKNAAPKKAAPKRKSTAPKKAAPKRNVSPKPKATKPKAKRNAAERSSAAPIKVTQHYRADGPGYATARERIIKAGQRDLFAPGASQAELLGFLRRNPTVIDAVKKRLGAERFKTASPSLLKKTMREVVKGAQGKTPKKNPRKRRRNPDAGALYETFTGQPHTGFDIVSAPNGTPANVDQLGEFLRFKWQDWDGKKYSVELEKEHIPALLGVSRNKDGYDTLYALGDFVLPLEPGDHGYITRIEYRAQKLHLGDTAPRVYYHDLGEETGAPPIFHVDKEGRLHFKAGAYWVEDRGIVN